MRSVQFLKQEIKRTRFLNMSWKLPSATPKSHLWQVFWVKDNIKNVKLPNFSPTFFKKEGILLFHHLTILPFDCLFVKRTKATGRWARLGNTDNRQRKICVIIYSFMVIFHQKPAFMVKIPHFRVYWRQSFVCVGVFTREWPPFLRATHACLCGGLRVARTEMRYLRRRGYSGCGNGSTPTMFRVMVKR